MNSLSNTLVLGKPRESSQVRKIKINLGELASPENHPTFSTALPHSTQINSISTTNMHQQQPRSYSQKRHAQMKHL